MRLVIRIFVILIILVLVFLGIWGGRALEKIGTYILQTPLDINHVRFIPHRLMFKLYGIDLPEKNIFIPLGAISVLPPRLELNGLKIKDKIILGGRNFYINISRHRNWEISVLFKGVDITKFDYRFRKGEIGGFVEGVYVEGDCKLYGVLNLKNIIYSDTGSSFLGISSSEFQKIIEIYKENLVLDFAYNGPLNEITELYRYRPGKKTFALLKRYLIEKVLSRE